MSRVAAAQKSGLLAQGCLLGRRQSRGLTQEHLVRALVLSASGDILGFLVVEMRRPLSLGSPKCSGPCVGMDGPRVVAGGQERQPGRGAAGSRVGQTWLPTWGWGSKGLRGAQTWACGRLLQDTTYSGTGWAPCEAGLARLGCLHHSEGLFLEQSHDAECFGRRALFYSLQKDPRLGPPCQ